MLFRVSGKHIDVGEALRTRVSERVVEVMGKFFDGGFSGHATIGREGFAFRTECVVHLDSGVTLHAEGLATDAYASADQAALRIENRLRRYKRRLKAHADGPAKEGIPGLDARSYVVTAPDRELVEEIVDFNPVIIAESTTTLERLSVSEAVMELDMTGAPVVMFRHAVHGRVNIVYRRADGNVGWLDPPAAA
jgi:ribosomal subunit interface protein